MDCWRRTRDFVDHEVLPVINTYWERAEFPFPLLEPLAKLNIVGDDITGYGCAGLSPIATVLVHMELNRRDGSLGTFLASRPVRVGDRFRQRRERSGVRESLVRSVGVVVRLEFGECVKEVSLVVDQCPVEQSRRVGCQYSVGAVTCDLVAAS